MYLGNGVDFIIISDMVLTFSEAVSSICVDVETVDDAIFESNEDFTLSITSSDPIVVFSNSQTTISIIDEDPGNII